MSKLSRSKGLGFEQLVARMLTEATGTKWRRRVRNLESESDVVPDDQAFSHIVVECKHANRLSLPAWWRQTVEQAEKQQPLLASGRRAVPLLAYRKTALPVRIQLDAHDVNPDTWPVPGRHVVTLDWESATQWLREQVSITEVV